MTNAERPEHPSAAFTIVERSATLKSANSKIGRTSIRVAVLYVAASLFPGVALAEQICAQGNGTFGPSVERTLGLTWTYKSVWQAPEVPYREFRYRSDGSISWQKDRTSGLLFTEFRNCFNGTCSDAFRRTAIRNLGGSTAQWGMSQSALGAC